MESSPPGDPDHVFVHAETTVPVDIDAAVAALAEALADGGLTAESRRAVASGFVMPVGPAHGVPERHVRVRFLDPYWRDGRLVLPLRWEVDGWSRRLFPILDANLELTAREEGTHVQLVGCYDPPLGGVGGSLDRVFLHRVADSTINNWLAEISRRLQQPLSLPGE